MRKLLYITILLAAACAEEIGPGTGPDEDEDSVWVPDPTEENDAPEDGEFAELDNDDDREDARPICALLPQDGSACTHACDPAALAEYIPNGTCVTFTCTLSDGSLYRTGGCNN